MCAAACLPPRTAAPVQIAWPTIPPAVTPWVVLLLLSLLLCVGRFGRAGESEFGEGEKAEKAKEGNDEWQKKPTKMSSLHLLSPHTLAVVASPMVATWERSPHSARKVRVKASRTTAGTTEAAADARVPLAAASAEEGFAVPAAAAAAAAVPARFGEVPLCLSVSSRSTSSSSFSHS